jgi:hypothetical protein
MLLGLGFGLLAFIVLLIAIFAVGSTLDDILKATKEQSEVLHDLKRSIESVERAVDSVRDRLPRRINPTDDPLSEFYDPGP